MILKGFWSILVIDEASLQQQQELLDDHRVELATEELEHLQDKQEKKLANKIDEKDEDNEDVSSALIKEIILKWIDLLSFAEKYRPDTVIRNRTVNIFNNNILAHF